MHDFKVYREYRKSIRLSVNSDCEVEVHAPKRMRWEDICAFVESHSAWIDEQLAERAERNTWSISTVDKGLLKTRAEAIIPGRVEYWSGIMGLTPSAVHVTAAGKRFGSCSAKNSLNFSLYLGAFTVDAIDYVVVHELAHIEHKNHGKDFYALIERYMPDYKEREKLLKGKTGEFWDLYDKDRKMTDLFVMRGDPIPEGNYHLVVNVSLFNMKGEMLIQKRAEGKHPWPGRWDVSACGSAILGETSLKAAKREVREELGIEINFKKDQPPAFTVSGADSFTDCYIVRGRVPLDKLKLQSEEVADARYATREEILAMVDSGEFIPYSRSLINMVFDLQANKGVFENE
ncbi:MAG: DUF45 domain-containing protein [Clostridia bacterium]|nr:DUF45 domain-containing protein [Clostridia bacterium]